MTPLSDSESMTRIWLCRSAGNWSMMRSTVDAAVVVCSVPKTRWPGLGGLDRDGDGLEVAHLADEHDVRIFAQRGPQRVA